MCHFVLVFFSPFSIAITSLGEERANLGAFRAFVWFVLVWICQFPLPLGVWDGLRFMIVALPGLFSYLFYNLLGKELPAMLVIFSFCGFLIVLVLYLFFPLLLGLHVDLSVPEFTYSVCSRSHP